MSQPDGRLAPFRNFFADLVTAGANVTDPRVQAAFATTPREQFLGPGPWRVFTPRGYIQTPSDDPVFSTRTLPSRSTKPNPSTTASPSSTR